MVLADVDVTDVATVHSGLVGYGADDVAGQRAMRVSDFDAEGLQRRRRLAPDPAAGLAVALKALATLRTRPALGPLLAREALAGCRITLATLGAGRAFILPAVQQERR